ncbi:hypothetical protein LBMAG53_08010 [Planctomycetota bacterium]|nr:hypothetical protein LBMAG53_08010 [Planctomycetota bacterium]
MSREKRYLTIGGAWFTVQDPLPEQCQPWFVGRSYMLPGYHIRTETSFAGTWYAILVESGDGELVIGGKRTQTKGSCIILLNGGDLRQNWYYHGNKETDVTGGFFVNGPWVQRTAPILQERTGGCVHCQITAPIFARWQTITRTFRRQPYVLTGAQAYSWCVEILGAFAGESDPLERDAVGQLRQLLAADLSRPLTIGSIARRMGYSREHLERAFAKVYGLPPAAWRERERLMQAGRLLTMGESPLKSISTACGYGSVSSLVRAFRRRVGVTPSEFRQNPFIW